MFKAKSLTRPNSKVLSAAILTWHGAPCPDKNAKGQALFRNLCDNKRNIHKSWVHNQGRIQPSHILPQTWLPVIYGRYLYLRWWRVFRIAFLFHCLWKMSLRYLLNNTPDDPLRGVGSNITPPPTDIELHPTSPQPDISLPVINASLFNWFIHITWMGETFICLRTGCNGRLRKYGAELSSFIIAGNFLTSWTNFSDYIYSHHGVSDEPSDCITAIKLSNDEAGHCTMEVCYYHA